MLTATSLNFILRRLAALQRAGCVLKRDASFPELDASPQRPCVRSRVCSHPSGFGYYLQHSAKILAHLL